MEITAPFGPNWAVNLLPFLDQGNLYNTLNIQTWPGYDYLPYVNTNTSPPTDATSTAWRNGIVGKSLPIYRCPSDAKNEEQFSNSTVPGDSSTGGNWARGNYGIAAGYEDYDHVAFGNLYKSSKAGYISTVNGMQSAPFASANFGCRLSDILDGPSNTFMVLELRAGLIPNDPRGIWAMGLPGASIVNAGRGPYNSTPNNQLWSASTDGGDELEDIGGTGQSGITEYCTADSGAKGMGCTATGTLMTSAMSRSMHAGGVNVSMADGSTRFVSNNIDQLTYIRLSSTKDGQLVGEY